MENRHSSDFHPSIAERKDDDTHPLIPKTDVNMTRLEKEAEFLFHASRCSAKAFKSSMNKATEEQIKAVIEYLRNYQLFKKSVPVHIILQINNILCACLTDSSSARKVFIKKHKFVQSILAEIFLKIILTEFHFLFCQ